MASAQAMEEELQQSVLVSEEGDYQSSEGGGQAASLLSSSHKNDNDSPMFESEDEELSDKDASGEELDQDVSGEELDQDASGEDDNDALDQQIVVGSAAAGDAGEYDEDAEGDEDLSEGAGAVKDRPVESKGDDMESVSSEASLAEDDEDNEESDERDEDEAAWKNGDAADEDEDTDAAQASTCMFCKQDEENDPSEDFEAFLVCVRCGENAHQQCARDAAAMTEENGVKRWNCPECKGGGESESEADEDADITEGVSDEEDGKPAFHTSQQEEAAGEVVGGQLSNGSLNDGSEVDDDLALDDFPALTPRPPRKRKSASGEPDDTVSATRKRRRKKSTDLTHHERLARDSRSAEPSRGAAAASRTMRLKASRQSQVTVERRSRTSLVLRMLVRPGNLKEILSRKKRTRRRAGGGSNARPQQPRATPARPRPAAVPALISTMPTPFTSESYSQPFYSFFDKETEEMKGRPYGGILTETEADTSKTLPTSEDRKKFEEAKQKAEDEWRARVLALQAEADLPVRKPKKASDNASQIECIEFAGWEIDTWYAAPYPAEYSRNRVLYICEFCLKYMNSDYVAWRHKLKCGTKHPPGDEIYRHESISIFEVDGRKHPVYCQNLCLLAKLFLGSKTLYYDVEPFLFYVLCEFDSTGYHFVGYFSKEKRASSQNNVSCILTLPIHQRKGYGNLLIDFSYLLTRVERKTGSPEKPLSDLGLVSYRNYWRLELCRYFLDYMDDGKRRREGLSISKISEDTGMTADDVVSALEGMRALVRDAQTRLYAFRVDLDYCHSYVSKWESKGYYQLKASALAWTPYVTGRNNMVNFELGHPLNTIAPREDDEAKVQEGHSLTCGNNGGSSSTNGASHGASSKADSQPQSPRQDQGQQGSNQQGSNQQDSNQQDSNQQDSNQQDLNRQDNNQDNPQALEPVHSVEKTGLDGKENAEPAEESTEDAAGRTDAEEVGAWMMPYKNIPPSRFEIFPPIPGSRRYDRNRISINRPSAARTPSGSSTRPKSRPPAAGGGGGGGSGAGAGGASKPRQRNANTRRKTGGTGRGPGRWPKGTKKSDYGNADSGPGLPPGWKEKQARLQLLAEGGGDGGGGTRLAAVEEKPAQDEVRVLVSAVKDQDKGENGQGAGLDARSAESGSEAEAASGGGGGGGGGSNDAHVGADTGGG